MSHISLWAVVLNWHFGFLLFLIYLISLTNLVASDYKNTCVITWVVVPCPVAPVLTILWAVVPWTVRPWAVVPWPVIPWPVVPWEMVSLIVVSLIVVPWIVVYWIVVPWAPWEVTPCIVVPSSVAPAARDVVWAAAGADVEAWEKVVPSAAVEIELWPIVALAVVVTSWAVEDVIVC